MFGGSPYVDNLVPMHRKLNQSGGAYYKMEQHLKKHLDAGSKVEIKIDVIYGDSKYPDRPVKFEIEYTINGEIEKQTFTNDANNVFRTAIPVSSKTNNVINDDFQDVVRPRPTPTVPVKPIGGPSSGSKYNPIAIDSVVPVHYY